MLYELPYRLLSSMGIQLYMHGYATFLMQTASSHRQSLIGTGHLTTSWTLTTRPFRLLSRLASARNKFYSHPAWASKVTLMGCGVQLIDIKDLEIKFDSIVKPEALPM